MRRITGIVITVIIVYALMMLSLIPFAAPRQPQPIKTITVTDEDYLAIIRAHADTIHQAGRDLATLRQQLQPESEAWRLAVAEKSGIIRAECAFLSGIVPPPGAEGAHDAIIATLHECSEEGTGDDTADRH